MASLRSLGVHTPSALPYLVGESILKEDAPPKQYHWETYTYETEHGKINEELVWTNYRVVWSQGGVVQKTFDFEIEQQKVVQAVLTWFATDELPMSVSSSSFADKISASSAFRESSAVPNTERDSSGAQADNQTSGSGSGETKTTRSRALVVFLKSQAHLFFLRGSNHIVNLPFEVERAFPTPNGLLLQRKLPLPEGIAATPSFPAVPQNSFLSSQNPSQPTFRLSSSFAGSFGTSKRSRRMNRNTANGRLLDDILKGVHAPISDNLPRLFSFTDPLSELGLVVGGSGNSSLNSSQSTATNKQLDPIDRAEEVVYVSCEDELSTNSNVLHNPLILVVTVDRQSRKFSIWNASYAPHASVGLNKRRTSSFSSKKIRRRSSYGPTPGTGTTTPGLRIRDTVRESFGGQVKGKSVPGQSQDTKGSQKAEDVFASQLDPDYALSQHPRETRRVSSLLSRGDLSTSFDKSAFQDLAAHSSFGAAQKRGPSFGGLGDRASIGASQRRYRASTPSGLSRLSLGDVTLNDSEEDLLDDTWQEEDSLNAFGLDEPLKGLRKEIVMIKITEVPFVGNAPIFNSSLSSSTNSEMENHKIFTVRPPATRMYSGEVRQSLFIHILGPSAGGHLQVELSVQARRRSMNPRSKEKVAAAEVPVYLHLSPIGVQQVKDSLDAIRIVDGQFTRALCLERNSIGGYSLSLRSGSNKSLPVAFSMGHLRLFDPYNITGSSPSSRKTAGIKRTLNTPSQIVSLLSPDSDGCFDIEDGDSVRHRLCLRLAPRDQLLCKILRLFYLLLPNNDADLITSVWWNISKTVSKDESYDPNWVALAATIFTLPLAFIKNAQHTGTIPAKSTIADTADHKSASKPTRASNTSPWEAMWSLEATQGDQIQLTSQSWAWTFHLPQSPRASGKRPSSTGSSSRIEAHPGMKKCNFIPLSIRAAKEFNSSSFGHAANASWKSISSDNGRDLRSLYIPRILVALHLVREEEKLNKVSQRASQTAPGFLAATLAQLGHWIQWDKWDFKRDSYYCLEQLGLDEWEFDNSMLTISGIPRSPWESPPSFFSWMERSLTKESFEPFPSLDQLVDGNEESQDLWRFTEHEIYNATPRTAALSKFLQEMRAESVHDPIKSIELLLRNRITGRMLETLPESFVAPLREAIISCQPTPPTTWSHGLLRLVGREDLINVSSTESEWKHNQLPVPDPLKDFHTICQMAEQPSPASYTSPEHDRLHVTRLVFKEDRRFVEALKLLEPLKPTVAECAPDPRWTESEYLDAQKGVMQWVMLRTFSLPLGNAMINYNLRRPLLTEKYPLHGFTTSCLMKPMNNIVTADRSSYTEEKFGWAFFHAGVFAGLSISRDAKGIDTSWIVFNKPPELTNKHAGLLLGLGLNGHLKNLAKWLSFKYLTPKHTMTTVGLLLGLAVSFLGTMDTLVTRLLSVHVTRMLPLGAAELNLSPFTQTTGLMGIGLLYYNTQHRRMSEIMLSEIEFVELTDPSEPPDTLKDEGYRLAAGFALGLINLGRGNDLKGLHDMHIIERLLVVAVGTKQVDVVHVLDQATAGATIAIALIFMKTENEAIAKKVDVPDTIPQFDYVRPDIFLLRTLAKHLIMWNDICPEQQWIRKNLPREYQAQYSLQNIKALRSEHMPFFNIVAGLLWSVGLKYAGSGDPTVRDFLIRYLDQFMRLCRLPALRYDAKLARNTVRNCQDLVALSAATIMAGTGDLDIFRRLRALHGRVGPDTPYGSHLAAHFALGALFMAGGTYTFGTSNLAIASLICAFYPLLPMDVLDNKAHLQAFRHLWVLAAEYRCVVVRDVDTHRAISLPVIVVMKDGTERPFTTPCLVPEIDSIASIITNSIDYWQVTLDFTNNPAHLASFRKTQTIRVRRRPARDTHSTVFSSTLAALNDAQVSQNASNMLKWGWLFELPVFADFEKSDLGLILPPDANSSMHTEMQGTVVDDRLILSSAAQSWRQADLWNLRVLFAWAEKVALEEGRLKWLGMEVIEKLRAGIMERSRQVVGVE